MFNARSSAENWVLTAHADEGAQTSNYEVPDWRDTSTINFYVESAALPHLPLNLSGELLMVDLEDLLDEADAAGLLAQNRDQAPVPWEQLRRELGL